MTSINFHYGKTFSYSIVFIRIRECVRSGIVLLQDQWI